MRHLALDTFGGFDWRNCTTKLDDVWWCMSERCRMLGQQQQQQEVVMLHGGEKLTSPYLLRCLPHLLVYFSSRYKLHGHAIFRNLLTFSLPMVLSNRFLKSMNMRSESSICILKIRNICTWECPLYFSVCKVVTILECYCHFFPLLPSVGRGRAREVIESPASTDRAAASIPRVPNGNHQQQQNPAAAPVPPTTGEVLFVFLSTSCIICG